jgi:hypothetical protein
MNRTKRLTWRKESSSLRIKHSPKDFKQVLMARISLARQRNRENHTVRINCCPLDENMKLREDNNGRGNKEERA